MGSDSSLSLHDAEEELMDRSSFKGVSGETAATGGPVYAEAVLLGRAVPTVRILTSRF